MNERYDRSVCANELLLRNTIIQKVISGWKMVDSFCLPEPVAGSDRIGEEPLASATQTADLDDAPSGLSLSSNKQDSTPVVETPAEEVVLADTCPDTLPTDPGA